MLYLRFDVIEGGLSRRNRREFGVWSDANGETNQMLLNTPLGFFSKYFNFNIITSTQEIHFPALHLHYFKILPWELCYLQNFYNYVSKYVTGRNSIFPLSFIVSNEWQNIFLCNIFLCKKKKACIPQFNNKLSSKIFL